MGNAGAISRGAGAGWSDWQATGDVPSLTPDVLAEIVDGGQAFRWYRQPDASWIGTSSDHLVRLRLGTSGALEWSAPRTMAAAVARALPEYLGRANNFAVTTDALPWRSDAHLAQCIAAFPGLRILRQPFGETLLGFLCSATKQIVQIKQMVGLLAERHGDRIAAPEYVEGAPASLAFRLPTWEHLATVPEPELRRCLLGFRARYISETARFLARHPGWLDETEHLPYRAAKERLCTLPGVGEKVADCVLLFGAGRLEAFPVDVWILKTMAKRYGLEGWKAAPLTQFGRAHFGAYAGLAQQFLFAWERRFAPREQRGAKRG